MTSGVKGAIKAKKDQEKPTNILRVIIIGMENYRLFKCFYTFPYFPNFLQLEWVVIIRRNEEMLQKLFM